MPRAGPASYAGLVMLAGLAAAAVAVLLYAVSTVMQAWVARSQPGEPRLWSLARSRTWLVAVAMLALAFLSFAVSTRVLPLPLAEVIRSSYVVLAAVLGHVVFHTRPSHIEYVGLVLALSGLGLLSGFGGERGDTEATPGLALTMAAVLVAAVAAAAALARVSRGGPLWLGVAEAALAGLAFAVLDMGVRSVPHPFDLADVITTAACWIGALGAPIGLLLFARSVTRTTVGLASTVLLVVDVLVASAWAARTFHDSLLVPRSGLVVGGAAMAVGVVLVIRSSSSAARPGTRDGSAE